MERTINLKSDFGYQREWTEEQYIGIWTDTATNFARLIDFRNDEEVEEYKKIKQWTANLAKKRFEEIYAEQQKMKQKSLTDEL